MKRLLGVMMVVTVAMWPAKSLAQGDDDCTLSGQTYPPDVTICSGGLVVTCQNGTWQGNDGRRCEGITGSYVGPRRPLQRQNDDPIPEYVKEKYPWLYLE